MVEILGCYSTTQTVLYAGCRPPLLWVAALGRKNIFSGNQWFRELLWVLLTRCAKSCSHCSSNLGVMSSTILQKYTLIRVYFSSVGTVEV